MSISVNCHHVTKVEVQKVLAQHSGTRWTTIQITTEDLDGKSSTMEIVLFNQVEGVHVETVMMPDREGAY